MKMQTTAKLNKLRISPRKVRLVADLVRGMNAGEAILQLLHSPKKAARPVKKLIESAIANAEHNQKMERASLVVKTIFVDQGQTLHRWAPRAFGRASAIHKRSSHVTVILEGDAAEQKKSEKKISEGTAEKKTVSSKKEKV